jgi:predicted transcriptional regulator
MNETIIYQIFKVFKDEKEHNAKDILNAGVLCVGIGTHLAVLVKRNLIEKRCRGYYCITQAGIELLNKSAPEGKETPL